MGENTEMIVQEEGRHELRRLLHWITENREKWQLICNQEFLELPVSEELALVENLEAAGLYSVAYVLFNAGWSRSQTMEAVRDQFVNELIAELPPEQLLMRIKKALRGYAAQHPEE